MPAEQYLGRVIEMFSTLREKGLPEIREAAGIMAESLTKGGVVHAFGSGHSVIPVMDIFPRYGTFVGFHPLIDPRLAWSNVVGPGGAPELLWIERAEGYVANFLDGFRFEPEDTMLIYSHGGLNAAPVEAALYARERGLKVVAVTSRENYERARATHSSGKKLGDLADVLIDNGVPLEDALVSVEGLREPVAPASTLAVVAITQSLVAEVAGLMVKAGRPLDIFVSPNVAEVPADHNRQVFARYVEQVKYRRG